MSNKSFKSVARAFLGLALLIGANCFPAPGFAADLQSLESLYVENFQTFYQPRFCGRNIARLVNAALRSGTDLKNAYILKVEGAGFFETSGFYTRNSINVRQPLGHFHVVMVADQKVFDFDLHEPLVLDEKDYLRLQFAPVDESIKIFGVPYRAKEELRWWTVTRFEVTDFIRNTRRETWKMGLGKYVDLDSVFSRRRVR